MNQTAVEPDAVSISVVATGATLEEAVLKLEAAVRGYSAGVPTPVVAADATVASADKPRRGRPAGSPNKPKAEAAPTAPAVIPAETSAPVVAENVAAPAAGGDKPVTKEDTINELQKVLKANADPAAGMADVRSVLAGFTKADGKKLDKIGNAKLEDYAAIKAAAEKFLADKA